MTCRGVVFGEAVPLRHGRFLAVCVPCVPQLRPGWPVGNIISQLDATMDTQTDTLAEAIVWGIMCSQWTDREEPLEQLESWCDQLETIVPNLDEEANADPDEASCSISRLSVRSIHSVD